jgi:hypothetical protein
LDESLRTINRMVNNATATAVKMPASTTKLKKTESPHTSHLATAPGVAAL